MVLWVYLFLQRKIACLVFPIHIRIHIRIHIKHHFYALMQHSFSSENRVGGEFINSPTSHTTVRTVPYTAVQST